MNRKLKITEAIESNNIEGESAYLLKCMASLTWSCTLGKDFSQVASSDAINDSTVDAFVKEMRGGRFKDPLAVLNKVIESSSLQPSPPSVLPFGFRRVKLVTWTPNRIILHRPQVMVSNRVLRAFPDDRFVRLRFRDEDGNKLTGEAMSPRIMKAISEVLRDGLLLSDGFHLRDLNDDERFHLKDSNPSERFHLRDLSPSERFHFLAMSASQLRSHSCWLVGGGPQRAHQIREWMGDFSQIRNVAKYVARLGQSLSASLPVCTDPPVQIIADWMTADDRFCFSDGCGMIGPELAAQVTLKLQLPSP